MMNAGSHAFAPDYIEVRGARVHNLKNVDIDIPLGRLVAVAGVSGSGKSSLALGVLYAEGSRRYLEALSAYTRRRLTQAGRADVDQVLHVPAALALHQRPAVPGPRSTFGTMSELSNGMRLLFSRVGSHVCPSCGTRCEPSLAVAAEQPLTCPACGHSFFGPAAEDLSFNSGGACPTCQGTGEVRTVNRAALVPDESLTIDQGAVLPWGSLMWDLMKQVAREMGVRTDVPFCELTQRERDIVFDGPAEKRHILYKAKKGNDFAELDFTYYNAVYTVENALAKVKDEKGLKRVARFLTQGPCPDCDGTRLSPAARSPRVRGIDLAQACQMTLAELCEWVRGVPATLPADMRPMAESICDAILGGARRLLDLGLGYLSLDRTGSTLSTGERQRVQLARAVRNRTTGVLYVLDEPSIGLHPSNIDGLLGVMRDLIADGNSVVMDDHDVQLLAQADHLVEMGPVAGAGGGRVIAQGSVEQVVANPRSVIGPFLAGELERGGAAGASAIRPRVSEDEMFDLGRIHLSSHGLHTVKPLEVDIPCSRLVAVTGVSGSGKTTLVLETLVPALRALCAQRDRDAAERRDARRSSTETAATQGAAMPTHVEWIDAESVSRVNLIDASPIGINVRSTVATYAGIHDELRRAFAKCDAARDAGLKAGDFSYNTGSMRCPACDGTGSISLDVQFLPDVEITCPKCHGTRYSPRAESIKRPCGRQQTELSIPDLMAMSVDEALEVTGDLKRAHDKLRVLHDLGLGYLTLGEATPSLSGGEAQRLKLASEMKRSQQGSVFVFDEPTIGLHPLDVQVLLHVFDRLVERGATVIVIEHDLDVIRRADYVVDMGPGGGEDGGRIVACGTPERVAACPESATGRYLA